MPTRAIVFDFNGTLSDDEPILCEIFIRLFGEHIIPKLDGDPVYRSTRFRDAAAAATSAGRA